MEHGVILEAGENSLVGRVKIHHDDSNDLQHLKCLVDYHRSSLFPLGHAGGV